MTARDSSHQIRQCDRCGGARHIYPWECPMDLHGEGDWAKTSCAACEEDIPSRAPREGDKYGNLYCSLECKTLGQDILIERLQIQNSPEATKANV